eukprot:10062764-Prorocentrum_lima.AAC.1
MTSSLVGSEMCIRDRLIARARVESRPSCVEAMVKMSQAFPRCLMTQAFPCLLYTSDAADDM